MTLTGTLFLIVFSAGLLLALFRHPAYGLYAYLAVFYLDPPTRWWGAGLPDIRWSLVAAAVTLLAAARLPRAAFDRPPWISTGAAGILILFTAWFWLQNLWALEPEKHFEASVLFTKYLVLYFLIYRLVRTPAEFRLFIAAHVAGCFYLGWLGFIDDSGGRLDGVGGPGIDEANALAMHVGTGIMLGSTVMLTERKWPFWVCLAAMPFILNTFVLAGSRGAFLALLCGCLALWLMRPTAYRRAFLVLGTLAVVLFLFLAHQMFWERMGTIEDAAVRSEEIDTSAESRFVLIEAQWQMAKGHPFGTGHRGTETLSPLYLEAKYLSGFRGELGQRSSHNTFMTALVEQGIPGALLYLGMLLWCAFSMRGLRRRWSEVADPMAAYVAGIGAALVVLLVAGMFVDYIKIEVQVWLFALLASAMYVPVPSGTEEPAALGQPALPPGARSHRQLRGSRPAASRTGSGRRRIGFTHNRTER
ncbi:MAG: O-antigen ligase family protein [Gammaproteobacteria bacterium]